MGERRSGCTLFNGLKRWDVGTIEEGDDKSPTHHCRPLMTIKRISSSLLLNRLRLMLLRLLLLRLLRLRLRL